MILLILQRHFHAPSADLLLLEEKEEEEDEEGNDFYVKQSAKQNLRSMNIFHQGNPDSCCDSLFSKSNMGRQISEESTSSLSNSFS
jgi:hypothetical protein